MHLLTFLTGTLAIKSICLAKCCKYLNPGSFEYFSKVSIATVRETLPPIVKVSLSFLILRKSDISFISMIKSGIFDRYTPTSKKKKKIYIIYIINKI